MALTRISMLLCLFGAIQVYTVQFSTSDQDLTILEGERVVLECGVHDDPDGTVVVWLFVQQGGDGTGAKALAFDGSVVTWQDKVEIDTKSVDGARTRNLKMRDAGLAQEGKYICQVGELQQYITLTINVPPTIEMIPGGGDVQEFLLGEAANIHCRADGKPEPFVTWGRVTPYSAFPLSTSFDEGTLVIDALGPYDSGIYECTAANGAGDPVTQTVDIRVRYAPNVSVEEEAIHTGPGDDLSIMCTFLASPEAEVKWLHNNIEVNNELGERNLAFGEEREEFQDTFTLRINGLQESDLGMYECVGRNEHGEATGIIELSAHPHSLVIVSEKEAPYSDQYSLEWQVVSFPDISQYELLVDELNNTVVTPFVNRTVLSAPGDLTARSAVHLLDGLAANTTYAVRLRAINAFGSTAWEEFVFTTADEGNIAPPPTTAPPTTLPPPTETKSQTVGDLAGSVITSSANQIVASFIVAVVTACVALLS